MPWWLGWIGFFTTWVFPIYALWSYRRGRRDGVGCPLDEEPQQRFWWRPIVWSIANFVPVLAFYSYVHLPTICYKQGFRVGAKSGRAARRLTSLPPMLAVVAWQVAIVALAVGLFSPVSDFTASEADCYAVGGSTSVQVDCSESHDARAIEVWEIPDESYPGELTIDSYAGEHCPADTEGYLFPTDVSWEDGDREIVCLKSE